MRTEIQIFSWKTDSLETANKKTKKKRHILVAGDMSSSFPTDNSLPSPRSSGFREDERKTSKKRQWEDVWDDKRRKRRKASLWKWHIRKRAKIKGSHEVLFSRVLPDRFYDVNHFSVAPLNPGSVRFRWCTGRDRMNTNDINRIDEVLCSSTLFYSLSLSLSLSLPSFGTHAQDHQMRSGSIGNLITSIVKPNE